VAPSAATSEALKAIWVLGSSLQNMILEILCVLNSWPASSTNARSVPLHSLLNAISPHDSFAHNLIDSTAAFVVKP
jgi:hypothetical protein